MRRGTPVVALAAAGFLLLQIGDSTAVPEASAAMLEKQAPFGMAAGTDHEFFLTHTRVIPIGRSSISVPILMYHYIRPAPSIYLDRLGYPLLKTYHFKAVAYIVTSFVGQSRYVTGEQIVEMDQNGIQIASHTIDHANIGGASVGSATYQ